MYINIDILIESNISLRVFILAYFIYSNDKDRLIKYVEYDGSFTKEELLYLIKNDYLISTIDPDTDKFGFYSVLPTQKLKELINEVTKDVIINDFYEDTAVNLFYETPEKLNDFPAFELTSQSDTPEAHFEVWWESYPRKRGIKGTPLRVFKQSCKNSYIRAILLDHKMIERIAIATRLCAEKEYLNKQYEYMISTEKFLEKRIWETYSEEIDKELRGDNGIIITKGGFEPED